MSQYRETIAAEFLFKPHSPQLLKFDETFETVFLQEHACVSSFSQPYQAITREQIVINFSGYLIYGRYRLAANVKDLKF